MGKVLGTTNRANLTNLLGLWDLGCVFWGTTEGAEGAWVVWAGLELIFLRKFR